METSYVALPDNDEDDGDAIDDKVKKMTMLLTFKAFSGGVS